MAGVDPTSLPTDNLYKFIALSGLALAGFCAWLRWKVRQDSVEKVVKLRRDHLKIGDAVARERGRWDRLSKATEGTRAEVAALKEAHAALDGAPVTPEGVEEAHRLLSKAQMVGQTFLEHEAELRRLQEEFDSPGISADQADLGARLSATEHGITVAQRFIRQLTAGIVFGLACGLGGFSAWYVKLQRPLDDKLQLELEVQTLELHAKKVALQKAAQAAKAAKP